jgi:hypothetical protein
MTGLFSIPAGRIFGTAENASSTVETAIVALLKANEALASLVADRIYPNFVPQSAAMPAITYQMISGTTDYDADSYDALNHPRMQIVCWGSTYNSASIVKRALKAIINGYKGTVDSITIQAIFIEDENDMPNLSDSEQLTRFGKRIDIIIWHNE